MGHTKLNRYRNLQERVDKSPQGAPATQTLFNILEVLFTGEEAELVSVLPINFFTVESAAAIWKKSRNDAGKILNGLADKGILLDIKKGESQTYVMAPTMAGFFEFSLMRTDGRFDKKLLSELFYRYINIEDKFLNQIFLLNPSIARVFVQEDRIQPQDKSIVLDYECATHAIKTANFITVSTCYCRHKMEHVGQGCDNPQDVCLTFNETARSLANHLKIKRISRVEAFEILHRCIDLGLVQIGSNEQDSITWICNCCSCCCEALLAYKKLGHNPRINTNFAAKIDGESCTGCGMCVDRCPVDSIVLCKDGKGKSFAEVDYDRCIGCGVCTRFCTAESIVLERRRETSFVPKDTFERLILAAINANKLQNLVFDRYHLWSYELLRYISEIILSLKPAKRLLANRRLQSIFVQSLANAYYLIDKDFFNGKKPNYSHPELIRIIREHGS